MNQTLVTSLISHGDRRWAGFDTVRGVYLAGFGRYLKIGFSTRMGGRLRELEEHTPEPLALFKVIENATRREESALHRRFDMYRMRGEWFEMTGELEKFAGEKAYLGHLGRNAVDGETLQLSIMAAVEKIRAPHAP